MKGTASIACWSTVYDRVGDGAFWTHVNLLWFNWCFTSGSSKLTPARVLVEDSSLFNAPGLSVRLAPILPAFTSAAKVVSALILEGDFM